MPGHGPACHRADQGDVRARPRAVSRLEAQRHPADGLERLDVELGPPAARIHGEEHVAPLAEHTEVSRQHERETGAEVQAQLGLLLQNRSPNTDVSTSTRETNTLGPPAM